MRDLLLRPTTAAAADLEMLRAFLIPRGEYDAHTLSLIYILASVCRTAARGGAAGKAWVTIAARRARAVCVQMCTRVRACVRVCKERIKACLKYLLAPLR